MNNYIQGYFVKYDFYVNRAKMRGCKLTSNNIRRFRNDYFQIRGIKLGMGDMFTLLYSREIKEYVIDGPSLFNKINRDDIWGKPVIIQSLYKE